MITELHTLYHLADPNLRMVRCVGTDGRSAFDVEQRRETPGRAYWLPFGRGLRFIPLTVADLPLDLRAALDAPWDFLAKPAVSVQSTGLREGAAAGDV